MPNNIQELRNNLFDTLKEVKAGTMPLDKAKVICEISQSIINSAKVEVDFIRAIGGRKGTGFIELPIDNSRGEIETKDDVLNDIKRREFERKSKPYEFQHINNS